MKGSPPILSCSGTVFDPAADANDCYWDAAAADHVCDFFSEMLQHTKGPLAGQPFHLTDWQADVVRTLFGWKRSDGTRRYRTAFMTLPRKNGKTTFVAAISLYMTLCMKEARAENYLAGADREQAGLAFASAAAMLRANSDLESHCKIIDSMKRIVYKGSFLRAIPANEEASHGFDVSFLCGDELHCWPNRKMYDVLRTGMGARPQPLCIWITTAGFDRESICYKEYSYATGVRDRKIDDPFYLPVIFEADQSDDWQDETVWKKANPNYGVSLREDYLRSECRRAIEEPAYQNTFRRLHLNQWTSQNVRFLDTDHWDGCNVTTGDIPAGAAVFGGLDLSATTDLTSWCLLRRVGDGWQARWKHWIPQQRLEIVERRDRVPYSQWAKDGFLEVIPGARIDQQWIERQILADANRFSLQWVGYDPWNAEGLVMRLEHEGVPMAKVRQTYAHLNAGTKELSATVASGTLDHGNNPLVNAHAENVEVIPDSSGNLKPTRASHGDRKKIDAIASLVTALAVALVNEKSNQSVYETRGPIFV